MYYAILMYYTKILLRINASNCKQAIFIAIFVNCIWYQRINLSFSFVQSHCGLDEVAHKKKKEKG